MYYNNLQAIYYAITVKFNLDTKSPTLCFVETAKIAERGYVGPKSGNSSAKIKILKLLVHFKQSLNMM